MFGLTVDVLNPMKNQKKKKTSRIFIWIRTVDISCKHQTDIYVVFRYSPFVLNKRRHFNRLQRRQLVTRHLQWILQIKICERIFMVDTCTAFFWAFAWMYVFFFFPWCLKKTQFDLFCIYVHTMYYCIVLI